MSRIQGKDTAPELSLRNKLRTYSYRSGSGRVEGYRPDLVFRKQRVLVFVDGCFWHGCPQHYVMPRSRIDFWSQKLRTNVERDIRQTAHLEAATWHVVRVWEHDLQDPDLTDRVARFLRGVFDGSLTLAPASSDWRVLSVTPINAEWSREVLQMCDLRDPTLTKTIERSRRPKAKA